MTPLDNSIKSLEFLTTDFGFKLLETKQDRNYIGEYLAIYRNENSNLQLEFSVGDNYFHCEIRRLLNGHPAKYSDKDNCIGFESLAILESNNQYEHLDYFAGGRRGLNGVLINTAKLFQRNKTFFTTKNWIDTKKIEQLRDEDFEIKFGRFPSKNKPTFFSEVKKQATGFLLDKGFHIILDSSELAPFDRNYLTQNIIFSKKNTTIKISAIDWRDFYYIYYIAINDIKLFEINLSKIQDNDRLNELTSIENAVSKTMDKLKQLNEKNGY